MEGRMVMITNSAELTAIDGDILNDLCYGIDIYVLNVNHVVCPSDTGHFDSIIHNEKATSRVIFISANMVKEMKIIEEVYYTESGDPFLDPLDRFRWYCPVCKCHYDDM